MWSWFREIFRTGDGIFESSFFLILILDTRVHSREFASNIKLNNQALVKRKEKKGTLYRVQFDERVENRIETGISAILSPQFTFRMVE